MDILFAERLKSLRKEKGISQKKLAEEIQITQRKISYLETGQLEPDLKTLLKISIYFGVSCDFLIGKSEY